MRSTERRLADILEAVRRIQRKVEDVDRDEFGRDEMLQVWVVHHLQIIGEACRNLPEDLRDRYSDIPWSEIIGMRHYLVHEYFQIDLDTTWNVVRNELDPLAEDLECVLEDVTGD